jgi:hypothetical protein
LVHQNIFDQIAECSSCTNLYFYDIDGSEWEASPTLSQIADCLKIDDTVFGIRREDVLILIYLTKNGLEVKCDNKIWKKTIQKKLDDWWVPATKIYDIWRRLTDASRDVDEFPKEVPSIYYDLEYTDTNTYTFMLIYTNIFRAKLIKFDDKPPSLYIQTNPTSSEYNLQIDIDKSDYIPGMCVPLIILTMYTKCYHIITDSAIQFAPVVNFFEQDTRFKGYDDRFRLETVLELSTDDDDK